MVSLLVSINLEPTDLRRLRSDVRTGRVLGAVLHLVPPSHIVEIHTQITDALMLEDRNFARVTFRLATETLCTYSL